jgi:iron complex outermembrane recepter protein
LYNSNRGKLFFDMNGSDRVHLSLFCLSFNLAIANAQPVDKPLVNSRQADSIILLNAVKVEAYQVSGGLRTIPGSLSVLVGNDLNLSDGTNLATTLNTVPGVTMQSGTYSTNRIVIRGIGSRTPYNTNRIRTYLNDIPLTTFDGVSTPEEIDLQSLGRIEVIKGPASALFGSGLGGSINLFTPLHNVTSGNVSAQVGSFNTAKTNLSGNTGKDNANLWGSFSHLQSDGYRENNQYKRTSFLSTAQLKQPGWSVNFLLLLIGVNSGIPSSLGKTLFENNPRAAAPSWKAIGGYEKYQKSVAGITLINNLSDKLDNKLTVFGRWNDNYEKRPFNNLSDQSLSAGFRNKLSHHTPKTDWVLGTEWIAEKYEWKLDLDDSLVNQNRENLSQLSIFTLFECRLTPKLKLSVAGAINWIRYQLIDLYPADGDQAGNRKFPVIFSPRIGVNYSLHDSWAIYASAGHGYSLPSPEETLLPAGEVNPDIKPEQGIQYELGTRINLFDKSMELDGAFYWIELNNLLVTKRVSEDIFTGMNAGRTRHQGFELLMHNRVFGFSSFPGKLASNVSYTATLNRFIHFTDDGKPYDGNWLPGIPDQSLQWQLTWAPAKILEMVTHLQYTGDQYLNDMNTLNYPGYFLCNLKATAHFQIWKRKTLSIYTGINNLTGTRYASMLIVNALATGGGEPRYYYPGLPRHGYAGIQLSF